MLFSCNTGNVEKLRNKILVSIKQKIKAGTLHLEWVEAKNLSSEYMVVK